jgi:peptidoglycan LD-endopeptidase CwlK
MASRSLDDLAQPVRQAAQGLIEAARLAGIDLLVYCTLRTNAEQAALYASGRTVRGPVLTCARPGASMHNPDASGKAWAFDAVPMVGGKPQWDDIHALAKVGALGEAEGLTWAGRWTGAIRERVHFQMQKGDV